jgi:protein-tyrosine phosphatase
VIDLHTHVLPGLDDGPRDLEHALAILSSIADDGASVVCATPHVRADYPTSGEAMERALDALRVAAADIPVEVRGGAEIALDQLPLLSDEERSRLGLGGNPRLLLLETPYVGWPLDLPQTCVRLRNLGIQPVVAHPERNPDVIERPALLEDVVRAGAVVQLTAASVDGRLGSRIAACARQLLSAGLAHVIASDAHAPNVRGAGLGAAAGALGDSGLGRWLVQDAPAALLAGEELPLRPLFPPPRRRLWPFGRR